MARKVFNPLTPPFDQVNDSISDITGLQTALDGKVAKAGDTMAGNLNMGTNNLIGGTGVTSILKLQGTTANGTATSAAIQALVGNNGATTAMTILNNGNVGIGVASPVTRLEINQSITGTEQFRQMSITNNSNQKIWLGAVADSVGSYLYNNGYYSVNNQYVANHTASGGLQFRNTGAIDFTANSGLTSGGTFTPTVRMRITEGGAIGINTITPGAQIHVNASTAATISQIIRGATSQTADLTQWQSDNGNTIAGVMSNGQIKYVYGGPLGSALQTVATDTYVQSRNQNLLTNGFGYLRDNTNFTQFVFDATNQATGFGGFRYDGADSARFINESFAVDIEEVYNFSYYIKLLSKSVPTEVPRFYSGIIAVDADGLTIASQHVYKQVGSAFTTLAADLNNGDTTITLTNATGWANTGTAVNKRIAFYPYTNSQGFTYPDYTYTRDVTNEGTWVAGGITGNVITLAAAWAGGFRAAGTKVANHTTAGTYEYMTNNVNTPTVHTKYNDYVGKIDGAWSSTAFNTGQIAPAGNHQTSPNSRLRWGAARIQLLYLLSYNTPVGTANTIVSGLSFGLAENASFDYKIGNITNSTANAVLNVTNTATNRITQVIKGIASQTADLLQIQNSSGVVLGSVSSAGLATFANASKIGDVVIKGSTALGNVSVGMQNATPTGTDNVFLGDRAGRAVGTGVSNLSIGTVSMYNVTSGGYNTALGTESLNRISTTSYNIGIGNRAGKWATGSNEIYISSLDWGNNTAEKQNSIIYGVQSTTPANQILALGGGGNVGIGTTTPTAQLQVTSGAAATVGQIIKGATSQSADLLQIQNSSGTSLLSINSSGDLDLKDVNIISGTTTGTKIGTGTSQKLSFWNATPIVQPTTSIAESAFVENSGGVNVNDDSTFDGYTIRQVVKALRDAGLLA